MRRHYARRRDIFIAAIGQELGDWLQLVPSGAGIQTLWTLSGPWADVALPAPAAGRGSACRPSRPISGKGGGQRPGARLMPRSTRTSAGWRSAARPASGAPAILTERKGPARLSGPAGQRRHVLRDLNAPFGGVLDRSGAAAAATGHLPARMAPKERRRGMPASAGHPPSVPAWRSGRASAA